MTLVLAHRSGLVAGDRRFMRDEEIDNLGHAKIWTSNGWLLGWAGRVSYGVQLWRWFQPDGPGVSPATCLQEAAWAALERSGFDDLWDVCEVIAVPQGGGTVHVIGVEGAWAVDADWHAVGAASRVGVAAAMGFDVGYRTHWVADDVAELAALHAHAIASGLDSTCGGKVDVLR